MSAVGLRWLGRLGRRARGKRRDWVVLLYHRVTSLESDPWSLAVSPRHFEEHLQVLRRRAHPTRLAALHEMLESRSSPRRAVVVTFDDGYADNAHEALPLLERYDVPATTFVTTGPLTTRRGLWWDELERALLTPEVVPNVLCLTIDGRTATWVLDDSPRAGLTTPGNGRRWRAWEAPPTARHGCYYELWQLLRRTTHDERRRVLDELLAWAGIESGPGDSHRPVSPDDLTALASSGLVEVGAHTVTHSALAALTPREQHEEAARSRLDLELATGRPVTSFAYPFGHHADFTAETQVQVRGAGFVRACSATGERIARRVNPFEIPRIHVDDLSGEAFESWLSDWLDD